VPPERHLEGVDDQLGAHVIRDRPADDHAAEGVEDDSEVDVAVSGRVLGDVHAPQPVRSVGLNARFTRSCVGVAAGAAPASMTPIDALELGLALQPLHPFAAQRTPAPRRRSSCTLGDP
jgi:hypothetical protein